MACAILQEEANFTRLSKLLVDKGTEALRNTLDAIHPPTYLAAALNANKATLLTLKPRVINISQWDLLFPPSGNPPDSKTFDVSLLTALLRNICGFSAPATGWNMMPPHADRSPQANFTRIRLFRNEVYAHVSSTQVDGATFQNLWQEISQALVDLKIPRKEIDDLKISPLGPEEEIYLQTLKEWCLKEEDCKEMLDDLKTDVELMNQQQRKDSEASKTSMQHLTQIAEENHEGIQQLCHASSNQIERERLQETNRVDDPSQKLAKNSFTGKIRRKLKSFHPGTRGWLLKKLEQWFTTDDESRALLLTAGPGFGKSVFAAKVCELFKEKEQLAACHFCDFSNSNLNDPMLMLQSLTSQMCENVPGFKEKLLEQLKRSHKIQSLKDAFQIYLQNPLDELEVEPRLIVIDGLDESATNHRSELVKLIADYFPSLPECVKVLMTSRPELSVESLSDIKKTTINVNVKENDVDLEEYLKDCIPCIAEKRRYGDTALRALVRKCQGSFLYAFYIQQELRKLHKNLDTLTYEEIVSVLPQGIASVYHGYFHRLETELEAALKSWSDLFKFLELLVAAKESLPLGFFARALDLPSDCRETKKIINNVNEAVSSLLYVSDDIVTVFHKSVRDWVLADGYKDHEYTVKDSDGKERLWLICEQVFEEMKATVSRGDDIKLTSDVKHALVHGPAYLVDCNIVKSFSWLVDIVIVNFILKNSGGISLSSLIRKVLCGNVSLSHELRERISWHSIELQRHWNCVDSFILGKSFCESSSELYLQAVLDYAPEGCFTEVELQIAKALLAKERQRRVRRNSFGVRRTNLLTTHVCKPFIPSVTAVGVSCGKTLAAVALENGTICILSLPGLAKLWQYSTQCNSIPCCTFDRDDSFVLYGKLETVLSIKGKNEAPFFRGRVERFKSCAFSSDGKRLVTNDGSSSVKLWDVVKQCLISVLRAGVPLDCCYFTNTGLFIIGNNKSSTEDSYCVWSAITLRRVDERSLSKMRVGMIKSERCNCCLRQDRKEIIPSSLQDIPVVHNDVECIFHLDTQSLRIIESTHFTMLAAWEYFIKKYSPPCRSINSPPLVRVRVTAIVDELFLFIDPEKLIVLNAVPRKNVRECLLSPTTHVLWCSFSPDGARLASYSSDGIINLWKVDTCQVYRRLMSNVEPSSAACWWSDRFFFVFCFIHETPSLSKYPVDENFEVTTTEGESVSLCSVIRQFSLFSGILDFSEGYLSFECGETKPVKVLDVNRSSPKRVILPRIKPMMKIAVSSGACFVLGAGGMIYLWKRNEAQPTRYDVCASYTPPDDEEASVWGSCFSIDSKVAVASFMSTSGNSHKLEFILFDLETGIRESLSYGRGYRISGNHILHYKFSSVRVFCKNTELIILLPKFIQFNDWSSVKELEGSFQRHITKEFMGDSKLCPKGNVLAIPRLTGDMEFIRLYVA